MSNWSIAATSKSRVDSIRHDEAGRGDRGDAHLEPAESMMSALARLPNDRRGPSIFGIGETLTYILGDKSAAFWKSAPSSQSTCSETRQDGEGREAPLGRKTSLGASRSSSSSHGEGQMFTYSELVVISGGRRGSEIFRLGGHIRTYSDAPPPFCPSPSWGKDGLKAIANIPLNQLQGEYWRPPGSSSLANLKSCLNVSWEGFDRNCQGVRRWHVKHVWWKGLMKSMHVVIHVLVRFSPQIFALSGWAFFDAACWAHRRKTTQIPSENQWSVTLYRYIPVCVYSFLNFTFVDHGFLNSLLWKSQERLGKPSRNMKSRQVFFVFFKLAFCCDRDNALVQSACASSITHHRLWAILFPTKKSA